MPDPSPRRPRTRVALLAIRYGFGVVGVTVGLVLLIVDPSGFGVDGFALGAGAGLSVVLFNVLFRMGIEGDREREREEEARRFMVEHGHWPDEPPRERPREPRRSGDGG